MTFLRKATRMMIAGLYYFETKYMYLAETM